MVIKRPLVFLVLFSTWALIVLCQQAGHSSATNDYVKQGNAYYDDKKYPEAISSYAKAIEADPNGMQAGLVHYKRAAAYEAIGKYNDAVSECSKSIAIDPMMHSIDPLTQRGNAYLLRGFLNEKAERYKEAISDYSRALIVNPGDKAADRGLKRIALKFYTKFMDEGSAALNSGIDAYQDRGYGAARKDLDRALVLFTHAKAFDTGKTAFGMAHFTKGLWHQMFAANILNGMKPAGSAEQLKEAYCSLAAVNSYYNRALQYLKDEELIKSLKERKALNDQNMAMARERLPKLEYGSENYIKIAELEAECIVNFQSAGELLTSGDHDGAKRILDGNNGLAAELRALKSANAEGIDSMSGAYARLNAIFSRPQLTDETQMKTNMASLADELNTCAIELDRARSGLVNKTLLSMCSDLMESVSKLRKDVKEVGERP